MTRRPNARRQLLAVIRKETLQTLRDKRIMAMLLIAPLLQLLVFGYAVDFNVDRLPTVVVDHDQSAASRAHARRLLADKTLVKVAETGDLDVAEGMLESGDAAAVIVFPRGLQRDLDRGDPARVQVLLDGADPNRSTVASMAAGRYFSEVGVELARERLQARASLGPLQTGAPPPSVGSAVLSPRIRYNPTLATPPYMIPGVIAMLLVVVTTIVAAMGLAREREMGTLEQVQVTPIRPAVLLLGKMTPFLVIGFLDVGLALTLATYVFSVPLGGSFAVLALATLLYLLSTLGAGLLISTVSRTQQQSFLGGFLFAMPAILLSGVMSPIRSMPEWLQAITLLNPLRYYVVLVRTSLLKDARFGDLWPQLAALAAFGLVLLTVASLRFSKRVA